MARSRNIKPAIFKNELLGVADPLCTLLFQSLWLLADREGRLEDRPLRIKAETFPYRDNVDIESLLEWLSDNGFIIRYEYRENRYIEILNFTKHQNPHRNEVESIIPSCFNELSIVRKKSVQVPRKSEALGLIPDSLNLIPDTLSTDSCNLKPDSLPIAPDKSSATQDACKEIWSSYKTAYFNRYQTEPVRNAKVNKNIKDLYARLGSEAVHVIAFYVTINDSFLIKRTHDVGTLLAGCESYRTQWATGRAVTTSQAMSMDKTQSNKSALDEYIEMVGSQNNGQ